MNGQKCLFDNLRMILSKSSKNMEQQHRDFGRWGFVRAKKVAKHRMPGHFGRFQMASTRQCSKFGSPVRMRLEILDPPFRRVTLNAVKV